MKILITGGSSGIGFLTGCVLASRGHEVILTTKTDLEIDSVKEKLSLLELSISVLKLDITDDIDVVNISDFIQDVDVFFLHAGVGNIGLLSSVDINLVKNIFEVNVFSNLKFIQKILKYDNKRIVMTSSLLAGKSLPFFGSYSMSKKCIDIMVKILRKENIFNNNEFVLIKPGAYYTGFNQYMILSGEKSNVANEVIGCLYRLFLLFEEKELNSIISKIVIAIEKGGYCYSSPFYQKIFMSLFR